MTGRLAWLLWAFIHVYLLTNFEKRVLVSIQWIWRYATRQRGARIIDEGPSRAVSSSAIVQCPQEERQLPRGPTLVDVNLLRSDHRGNLTISAGRSGLSAKAF
jgi:hypothetical protein